MSLTGLNQGINRTAFLSGNSKGKSISLPFLASRGDCTPCLFVPSHLQTQPHWAEYLLGYHLFNSPCVEFLFRIPLPMQIFVIRMSPPG